MTDRRALRCEVAHRLPCGLGLVLCGLIWLLVWGPVPARADTTTDWSVPLSAEPGDAVRGRELLAQRSRSLCVLCHQAPMAEVAFQGNLAPDLAGAGLRNTEAQLRQRLVDSRTINPASVMPPYHARNDLRQVAPGWVNKTILTAQEIEDVIAYLRTLQ